MESLRDMIRYKIEMRIVDTHTDEVVVATSVDYQEDGDFLEQAGALSRRFQTKKVAYENEYYPV